MSVHNNWSFSETLAERLVSGITLVTASKRLARELHGRYDKHQQQLGNQAWETADILPLQAWLRRCWNKQRQLTGDDRILISSLQSSQVWEGIIRQDITRRDPDTEPLWNVPATAQAALGAWALCREWGISLEHCAKSGLQDHRRFAHWAREYLQTCEERNWIDLPSLPDELAKDLERASSTCAPEVQVHGFYTVPNRLAALINRLRDGGSCITVAGAGTENGVRPTTNLVFDNEYDQWLAAAEWARTQVESDGKSRIGIIAPDIHGHRHIIERALGEVLEPNTISNPRPGEQKAYHVSPAGMLNDFPVVASTVDLLSLLPGKPVGLDSLRRILRSEFIAGAKEELHPRSRVELACASTLFGDTDVAHLSHWMAQTGLSHGVPALIEALERSTVMVAECTATSAPSKWANVFLDYLDIWGWPGNAALDSETYQAVQALKNEIAQLRGLDQVNPDISASKALDILVWQLGSRYFEPESSGAMVQVLDIHEAAGLEFDALWLGNLSERDWPPGMRTSPFVPGVLQKDAGIPWTTPEGNLKLATTQLSQITSQAETVTCSYYRFEDDLELMPSTLLGPETEPGIQVNTLLDEICRKPTEMERYDDPYGRPMDSGQTHGGVSLIADQAACPFRAYAIHRLGCHDLADRLPGLDARQRGTLIHEVLESIWTELGTSTALHSLSETDIDELITRHVRASGRRFYHRAGLGNAFIQTQNQWLRRVLNEWLELEESRERPWTIHALEQDSRLKLGPLELRLKIDRIDQFEDGSLALIDYKTGGVDSLGNWIGERPAQPQMPLYLLAVLQDRQDRDQPVSALLIGRVRLGEAQLLGLSVEGDYQSGGSREVKVRGFPDSALRADQREWPSLIDHWRQTLGELANQVESGYASVDPANNACDTCFLHAFCRIHERVSDNA